MKHLIDTHAHLSELQDKEGVVYRAKQAGVEAIIAVGTNYKSSKETIQWAESYPDFIFPGVGIHPTEWMNDDIKMSMQFIQENIECCIVLGEIGLDYWNKEARNNEEVKETQRQLYIDQLKIANENEKPVSVHGRGSWEDALSYAIKHGPQKVVFHWYSGPLDVLKQVLDNGYYISATPAAEYSRDHRAALINSPLERIMLETDCPVYMRNRKRTTEPADVTITLKALSKLKEIDTEEIAKITTRNAKKFFSL